MYLGLDENKLEELKAYWTCKEIAQQPTTWLKTIKQIKQEKNEIQKFINNVVKHDDFDIVLTGAGTSEFVGNSCFVSFSKKYNHHVKSYATTDIVEEPEVYLSKNKSTLLVSYGRSGNSPESVGAVDVANAVCNNVYHLFITCNCDGALSKFAKGKENCYAINLTEETHDRSFAMTSSYSNMYLATLLALNLDAIDEVEEKMLEIIKVSQNILDNTYNQLHSIVLEFDFNRIVYLGANTLKGVAQESALKMCELNAGEIDTVFDSPLGFRHGPKSVINNQTLCVVYLSDKPYSRQYEIDLIKEMSKERKLNKILVVSSCDDEIKNEVDYFINLNTNQKLENVYLGLSYILIGQIISVFKSLKHKHTPDNPCPTGEVNRVVKGVIIYKY